MPRVLVTGATGYIGGRLVPHLLAAGFEVRCLARNPGKLADDHWRDQVEVVAADVLDAASLDAALEGCDHAYYLVHSMGDTADFAERDRLAARTFRDAADRAGLQRIVYLGGLGVGEGLSAHLSSRHEVGAILAGGTTPVTELRAAVIIGSGSVSFEMLRYLTEVLPVMVTPRWVRTRCQPIAIRNVLQYLVAVLDDDSASDRVYEIGGPDVVTYEEMMQVYAAVAGLPKRLIVPVPVLTPGLSSRWIGLVTPLPVNVARPLVDSLKHEVVVHDPAIERDHPVDLIPYRTAVELALERSGNLEVPTRWSDATTSPARPLDTDPEWSGGRTYTDHRVVKTAATADDLFWAFSRIGGDVGYYGFNWAWALRGFLDSIAGGVGLRRGRRHPEMISAEETVDFWRVALVDPPRHHLQLFAEMRLPGDAWLEWKVGEDGGGRTLHQTAYFRPRGLFGRVYWFVLLPFHTAIFPTMARRIAAAAEQRRAGASGGGGSPGGPQ
jgi:uncharacterized protein YbjT (DUF2867 family)